MWDIRIIIPWDRIIPASIRSALTIPPPDPSKIVSKEDAKVFFNFSDPNRRLLLISLAVLFVVGNALLFRLVMMLSREKATKGRRRPGSSNAYPTHLLVVLGSGGHTAEMLNMLRQVPNLTRDYTHRTYVVSSGDDFSALKASEFEKEIAIGQAASVASYDIATVRRARRVHQSLFSTPYTSLLCLWDCIQVLRGKHTDQQRRSHNYPDLILTNGPGTGVVVVLASIILLYFGFGGQSARSSSEAEKPHKSAGQMRIIFIESWARVKTLSLSGQILEPFVDRFLVQWAGLVEDGRRAECAGYLVA